MLKLEQRITGALERLRTKLQKPIVIDVMTVTLNNKKTYVLPVKIGAVPGTMEAALLKEFEKERWHATCIDGYVALPSPPPREYSMITFQVLPENMLTNRHGNQYTGVGLRRMLSELLLKADKPMAAYQLRQILEAQGVHEQIKNLKGRVSATLCYPEFCRIDRGQYVHVTRMKEFSKKKQL